MSPPWMPLHIGDYKKDTGHLRGAGHGGYLLLMMHYWATGGLPSDDFALQNISTLDNKEWKRWGPVLKLFFNGNMRHKRIDFELEKVAKVSESRRQAAKKRHANAGANAGANAEQLDTQPTTNNQHTSSALRNALDVEEPPTEKPKLKNKGTRLPEDWHPDQEGMDFAAACVGAGRVHGELAKFRDYWSAKAGKDAVKVDWTATWRNWCRKAGEGPRSTLNGHHLPRPGSKEDQRERTAHALRQLDNFIKSGSNDSSRGRGTGPADARLLPFGKSA